PSPPALAGALLGSTATCTMRLLAACGGASSAAFSTLSGGRAHSNRATPLRPTARAAPKTLRRFIASVPSGWFRRARASAGRATSAAHPAAWGGSLAPGLEGADGHLLVELQLELVADGQGLLAVLLGVDVHVPAQQVDRPVLADVQRVFAQLGGRLDQRDVHRLALRRRQPVPDLHLDLLALEGGEEDAVLEGQHLVAALHGPALLQHL